MVKTKKYWHTNNIKMENNELKNVSIKNRMCCYFSDVIIIEYFDFGNILLDEKSNGNIYKRFPVTGSC